jgi:hypothetical protein
MSGLEKGTFAISAIGALAFFILAFFWPEFKPTIWFHVMQGIFFIMSFAGILVLMINNWILKKDQILDYKEIVNDHVGAYLRSINQDEY